MANAALQLCDVAHKASSGRLFALIFPDNAQSLGVVRRAGYVRADEVTKDDFTTSNSHATLSDAR